MGIDMGRGEFFVTLAYSDYRLCLRSQSIGYFTTKKYFWDVVSYLKKKIISPLLSGAACLQVKIKINLF